MRDANLDNNRASSKQKLLRYKINDLGSPLAEYKFFRSDAEETLLQLGRGQSSGVNDFSKGDDSMTQLEALEAKLAAGGRW